MVPRRAATTTASMASEPTDTNAVRMRTRRCDARRAALPLAYCTDTIFFNPSEVRPVLSSRGFRHSLHPGQATKYTPDFFAPLEPKDRIHH